MSMNKKNLGKTVLKNDLSWKINFEHSTNFRLI
ncbi:hypothetical protein ES705_25616 [subsurface metagenome]